MSWRKITMKFTGTCIVCNKKINADEIGLWSKGVGVKHEKCAGAKEITCIICGGPAGCALCEFTEECDLDRVSQLCVCKKCSSDTKGAFASYQAATKKKFHILNV